MDESSRAPLFAGGAAWESIPPEEAARRAVADPVVELAHRAEMEARFGQSFADIKVHDGPNARAANIALGARAFVTPDQRIVFADRDPSKQLVAHELTHIVQQRRSSNVPAGSAVSKPGDQHEREAERVGDAVGAGERIGEITATPMAAFSRSMWDWGDAFNAGAGTALKAAASTKGVRGVAEDAVASIMASPAKLNALLVEQLRSMMTPKQLQEFLQVTAGLLMTELAISTLMAIPDPTMSTKVLAAVLQGLLIAFVVWVAIHQGNEAREAAQRWWSKIKHANGDPKVIDSAADDFARLTFHVVSSLAAAAPLILAKIRMPEGAAPHARSNPSAGAAESRAPSGASKSLETEATTTEAAIQTRKPQSEPAAIYNGHGELSPRQTALLEQLPKTGSKMVVRKSEVSITDLAALTARTGDEFTVFTRGPQRMVVRGDPGGVPLSLEQLQALKAKGWRWSGHTHPGKTDLVLESRGGDRKVLEVFGQKRSLIVNSRGARNVFDAEGNARR